MKTAVDFATQTHADTCMHKDKRDKTHLADTLGSGLWSCWGRHFTVDDEHDEKTLVQQICSLITYMEQTRFINFPTSSSKQLFITTIFFQPHPKLFLQALWQWFSMGFASGPKFYVGCQLANQQHTSIINLMEVNKGECINIAYKCY